jgi:phosphoglycolate phosphatase
MLSTVDAILFDLDGTLIDSTDVYYCIVELALEKLGLPPVNRITILEASRSPQFDWRLVLPEYKDGTFESILNRVRRVIAEIHPQLFRDNACIIPGVDLQLRKLSEEGLKLSIVTATQGVYLIEKMEILERAGLAELFEIVITGDEVVNKKPAPDSLLMCAEKLNVIPNRCIYIGDMRTDIEAGKAAGMGTVGVLTGFDNRQTLESIKPDAIIQSVAVLDQLYDS